MTPPTLPSRNPLLLIVEDDEALRERLVKAFERRGFEVAAASTGLEAESWLTGDVPEFVLLDLRLPGSSGLSLVSRFKDADPETRIVVLTGYGSIATAVEAVKRGAINYLNKPADADEILAAFQSSELPSSPEHAMSLDRVEWEHINRVLMDCGGNVSEAARVLRIHRRSLQRKLDRWPPNR